MNTYKLYLLTFPNNKHYVGITSAENPNKRWRNGKGYETQPLIHNAIQKYGWKNVQHHILLEGLTREEACEREKFYISLFRSNDFKYGYNMTLGGEGMDKGKNWGSKEYIKAVNENRKSYHQQWYQDNSKHLKEYRAMYYLSKKNDKNFIDQRKKYMREYYLKHQEEARAKGRENYWKKKNAIKPPD